MKRLLASFFLFLEQFNTNIASVDFDMETDEMGWWDKKVWINELRKDVSIPSNFLPLFDMIIEVYGKRIWEESENEEGDEYYRVNIEFRVDTKTMVIGSEVTVNSEEDAGDEYELNNDKDVDSFLDETGLESISIKYEGGGDDGYLEDKGEGDDGEDYELSAGVRDVAYNYLTQSFGGWENNEGARGEIIITKDTLSINHIWFTREMENSELQLVIKLDDLQ
jgi:hypothetical protein